MQVRTLGTVAVALFAVVSTAHSQPVNDHLECYQVKDPLALTAVVDLASPQFGLDPGCKVSKAKYFCAPAKKTVISATAKKVPIVPLPITGPDAGDRVCYKVKCPLPATAIPDQVITDQFGTRTVSKFKASYLCTPAVKGPYRPTLGVGFRVEIDGALGQPALPPVLFDGGGGFGAIRSFSKHRGDPLPSANPAGNRVAVAPGVFTYGVATGPTDGWAAWYQQVQAFGATCATLSGEECNTNWLATGLGRSGTVSAIADDGETLATWHLTDAWPATIALDGPTGPVVGLTLAAGVDQFSFGSGPAVQALFGGVSPTPAVLPSDPTDDAGLALFVTRYHDLGGALYRLNGLGAVADAGSSSGAPEARQPRYQAQAGHWAIEVDGVISGGFKEITGLESEVEIIEYRDGDDPITHKRAGKNKYKNLILKRGIVNDPTLLEWFKQVLAGTTERKSGSVIYLDREGNEVLRYNFLEAWPVRWKAPELNSNSDTHIVEEIEFV
ncbi:MAG: phage tail protein, partial [Byssovorax sp.]